MKKLLILCMALAIIFLSACSHAPTPPEIPPGTSEAIATEGSVSTCEETEEPAGETTSSCSQPGKETSDAETTSTTGASLNTTEPVTTDIRPTTNTEDQSVVETTSVTETPKATEPLEPVETETTAQETDPPTTTAAEETKPEEIKVVRADPTEVERLVAQYVNQQRSAEGAPSMTMLSGLTQVARYRSNQIIYNFSHANSATICTELQYGEFVDMTQYGMSESDSYYQGYNREALAKGNWGGTAEEIAQKIATGFKNSSSHWKYLSSDEYSYMAVGCTYDEATSMWYCCICVSAKNYGG